MNCGDLKTRVRYMLCSNNLTNSILKIYFGIKKDGWTHINNVIRDEIYNRKYRKPWVIRRKEIIKQKKEYQNDELKVLIGIMCEDKSYEKICASIMAVSGQSLQNKCEIICIGINENCKIKIKQILEKSSDIIINFADTYRAVNEIINSKRFDYYGEIQAGDLLHPYTVFYLVSEVLKNGLKEIVYFDEWDFEQEVQKSYKHNYKSDFSIISLYSKNYIGAFFFVKTDTYLKLDGFDTDRKSAKYYDYLLRLIEMEKHNCNLELMQNIAVNIEIERKIKDEIKHISEPMYYKQLERKADKSEDISRIENDLLEIGALKEYFKRCGTDVQIKYDDTTGQRHISYYDNMESGGRVSIIIPNKEHRDDLKRCIDSILKMTTYDDYEIIIVENGSVSDEIREYYKEIEKEENIKICNWDKEFNYSAINNYAVRQAEGEYIVLLNNDIEVISENWLQEMLMYAKMPNIGAVGCMLYYPDNTVQHAGVILGIGGVAGHSHKHFSAEDNGYNDRMLYVQELSAVTAACMMTRKDVYVKHGGLDEKFEVAFNDIDYCMKIRKSGFDVIFTPYAKMYHYESLSRGYETTQSKEQRFRGETREFLEKWKGELKKGDVFYNPHLTLRYENFELR